MGTLTADIAEVIGPHLGGWVIDDHPATPPANLAAGAIYLELWRDEVKADPASDLQILHTVTLRLMIGATPSHATDALLTSALDDLMIALHDHAYAATWGKWSAQYAIFPNSQGVATYPGWEITFPALPSPNHYRKKQRA